MRWITAILFCFLAACQHPAYRLGRQGRTLLVTPPASKPDIKNARKHPSRKSGCDIEAAPFTLAWRGNTAHVGIQAETYYAPPETVRPQAGSPAITIAPL